MFLKISQNSQENTCVRVSFLIKLQASGFIRCSAGLNSRHGSVKFSSYSNEFKYQSWSPKIVMQYSGEYFNYNISHDRFGNILRWRLVTCGNQSIDLLWKPFDWFLHVAGFYSKVFPNGLLLISVHLSNYRRNTVA